MHASLMEVGSAEVTPGGMEFHGDLSFEQWAEVGRKIGRASTAFQLAVGDWLVYGQEHFEGNPALPGIKRKAGRVGSELVDYACSLTGLDRQTISNYAWTSRNVPCSLRKEQLSYQHYHILAKLPEPEQREWVYLATGYGERVPTRQLAKSIELSQTSGERRIFSKDEIVAAVAEDRPYFIDAPEPALDRFIRSMRRQNFDEWTPDMKAYLWKKFHLAAELMEAMGRP